jgi:hypothetical protein
MRRMILVLVVAAVLVAMTATAAFAGNQPIRNGSEDRTGVASSGPNGGGPNGGGHKSGGPGGQVGVAGGNLSNGSNGSDNSR